MRRVLFAAAALIAICAAVAAAEKLSREARRKIAQVQKELDQRVRKKPLTLYELAWIETRRLEEEQEEEKVEPDPLKSLYVLRYSLRRRIRELNPYWRPKDEPEKVYKYIYKEYDITDLVTRPPDRYAPSIGFGHGYSLYGTTTRVTGGGGGGIIGFGDDDDDEDDFTGFGWEKIQEMLDRFLPEEQDGERSYRYSGGKLVCHVTEEDAKLIEDLLGRLRRAAGYSVNIEVKYIRAGARYLRELGGDGGGSAIYLTPEAEKRLLEDIAAKRGVEVLASSEVIAANNQVVHIREGQQLSLLMDYDICTVGIPSLQPVVKLVNEGLICQFRPVVFKGGSEVCVDVLTSLSQIRKEIRKGEFLGGELMFPAMEMSRLRTSVQVPSGRAVLVGGTALLPGDDGKDRREFVVYLKPTVSRKNRQGGRK